MSVKITYFVNGTTIDNENSVSSGWFDVVLCSDLKRATDSAKLIFDNVTEIIDDYRLRECNYGKFNGQTGWEYELK